jgi:transposase
MKKQLKMDGRVSPETLYERRKLIVNLYRGGMKVMAIAEAVGMSWNAVRKAIDLYEAEGMKALKPKKRGRPTGTARTLTPEQEKQVQRDIRDK